MFALDIFLARVAMADDAVIVDGTFVRDFIVPAISAVERAQTACASPVDYRLAGIIGDMTYRWARLSVMCDACPPQRRTGRSGSAETHLRAAHIIAHALASAGKRRRCALLDELVDVILTVSDAWGVDVVDALRVAAIDLGIDVPFARIRRGVPWSRTVLLWTEDSTAGRRARAMLSPSTRRTIADLCPELGVDVEATP